MDTINVINFLIIAGCLASLFAVFYINRKSFDDKKAGPNPTQSSHFR